LPHELEEESGLTSLSCSTGGGDIARRSCNEGTFPRCSPAVASWGMDGLELKVVAAGADFLAPLPGRAPKDGGTCLAGAGLLVRGDRDAAVPDVLPSLVGSCDVQAEAGGFARECRAACTATRPSFAMLAIATSSFRCSSSTLFIRTRKASCLESSSAL